MAVKGSDVDDRASAAIVDRTSMSVAPRCSTSLGKQTRL